MDALSPAKACDPWAVHSAKTFEKEQGGAVQLTDRQKRILLVLEETGGVEPRMMIERLNISPADLEREIATLRHLEKVSAELREGRKYIVLWQKKGL
jgi:predicted HTH transcriptional regulator